MEHRQSHMFSPRCCVLILTEDCTTNRKSQIMFHVFLSSEQGVIFPEVFPYLILMCVCVYVWEHMCV